ncbi:helix-turn-helix domain-containing protein [Microbispora bryophytorum]|uniref:helix-turn-helix domain-containing protein n=1 Tax=Microbispora bryophytorum TaxID=1460882 RepID=UPI00371EE860
MSASRVVAKRVKEFRQAHGWSAQELARRCAEAGMPHLDRSIIANLESGRRAMITIDEVLTLAWVLSVPPLMMFLPLGSTDEIAITPDVAVHPGLALKWVMGEMEPPTSDRKVAAHVDQAMFRLAAQPLILYARLDDAQEALSRAENDLHWAMEEGPADRVDKVAARRDDALNRLADVLNLMVDVGVRPPAIWWERYDRMRELGLLKLADRIERLAAEVEGA